jgi:hypothetical protein|tara:strand:+ start:135 stop:428 length:294 start_codon:yes stop_codon:yes gene_type:complete
VELTALNELTQAEIIARGNEAKRLKENLVLNEAFNDILQNITEAFLDSHAGDDNVLNLHRQAVAVKAVRGTLARYIDNMAMEVENNKLDKLNGEKNG